MKITTTLAALAVLLAGCATQSGTVAIGGEKFMLSKQAATGFSGLGNLKTEAIGEGSRHCAALGREFQLVSSTESQPPYVFGNYPRVEITFACGAAGGR